MAIDHHFGHKVELGRVDCTVVAEHSLAVVVVGHSVVAEEHHTAAARFHNNLATT